MPTFVYTALDSAGNMVTGNLDGDSQQTVLSKLHSQGYHVTDISQGKSATNFVLRFPRFKKLKLQSLVVFTRQFATMINAGVNIIKCLDILESQSKDPVLKPVLAQVMMDVKGGMNLTDAFGKHPHIFSRLYVNMIRAAEAGGILDQILDRIAGFLENDLEVRTKIKSAMMYPIIVLIFSCGMILALFTFILPKFKQIFVEMGVDMPIYTRMLFDISGLMVRFWYVPLIVIVIGVVALRQVSRTPGGKYFFDSIKLRVPIVGELVQKLAISRFARTFGTLVSSGVPMMRSLEIVGETSGNAVIAKAVETARESVREGQKISAPLGETGLFPGMVIHMIDVGEETGRLSEMLVKVSEFYDKEVEAAVKGLTSLIEPMLIVLMGSIVGFIAISIMGPIFKLVSSIS